LILDTTFLVDAERSDGDLDAAIEDDDDVAVAAVSIAELRVGVLLANDQRRPWRAAYLEDLLTTVPVLPYDLDVAEAHAELLVAVQAQGRPRGAHDLIIAATAKATRRVVVTADVTAFADLPGIVVGAHR
jgi:tRNA(fMet)-specific endonuclease VapC